MAPGIDRRELVRRHNPVLTSAHPTNVLTVGNGDFALSVDVSGLQSFPRDHELTPAPRRLASDGFTGLPDQPAQPFSVDNFQIPLRTQSTWGWYETGPSREFALGEASTDYPTGEGLVPYLDRMGLQRAADLIPDDMAAGAWFHFNPRRAHLGRLALVRAADGLLEEPTAITSPRTELDLWSGLIRAEYTLLGEPVRVLTVADPSAARVAVQVVSPLLSRGWGVAWVFDPQPDDLAWFELPLLEATNWVQRHDGRWLARHTVSSTAYWADIATTGKLQVVPGGSAAVALATNRDVLEMVVTLDAGDDQPELQPGRDTFAAVRNAAATWWKDYWSTGAIVTLEDSDGDRAAELERRILLSQYLTAVNCSGTTPPAETGLTYNTWSGKFHLEMHWWHAAHFAQWGRGHLLERSLDWYHGALDAATATARRQGYRGARWPKQTDLSARESPSCIGVFLIWQQPHLIYLLELLRQEGRDVAFLRAHYPLIEATADFMADFVAEREGRYVLPPPLIPAQESYSAQRASVADPTFELAYWSWGLRIANEWRGHLGMDVREDWQRVSQGMRRPAVQPDGTYPAIGEPALLIRRDHPSMLMALGWLPEAGLVDPAVMSRTLDAVWRTWDLQTTWGWDYPVMAMTATALGDIGAAFDALLHPSPKNTFLANGHNPQMPGFLSLYLPANGGLLAAIAHIVAALGRGAEAPPGWRIRAEGFPGLDTNRHAGLLAGSTTSHRRGEVSPNRQSRTAEPAANH